MSGRSIQVCLLFNSHGALALQIHSYVCAAGLSAPAVGIVQSVRHIQQQATIRIIGRFDPIELNAIETQLTRGTPGCSLADRKTLAADLRAGDENKKMRAAADRLAIRVYI